MLLRIALVCMALGAAIPTASSARVYHGSPNLVLTGQVLRAGGGAAHFRGAGLLAALTGPGSASETGALRRRHGAAAVADFGPDLTIAVDDAVRLTLADGARLPAYLPPLDRRQLIEAIWRGGREGDGRWDVGIFFERMISHRIHRQLMHDLDADPKVGPQRNAMLHEMLTDAVTDVARADGLPGAR